MDTASSVRTAGSPSLFTENPKRAIYQGKHWSINFQPGILPSPTWSSWSLLAASNDPVLSCHISWWCQRLKSVSNHHLQTQPFTCRMRFISISVLAGVWFDFVAVLPLLLTSDSSFFLTCQKKKGEKKEFKHILQLNHFFFFMLAGSHWAEKQ